MVGSTVGPYEIVGRIGAGGMGEVFLGRDPRLQRPVALKRVTAAGDARAHVLREARAAARLTHPHIAAVHDVVDTGDSAFIVMEFVDGESLAARIARGPLPPGDVIRIGRELASALAAAHAQGVVHRDLKPSNIQLTHDGSAKVLDFGVARLSPVDTAAATAAAASVTVTSLANPGTPAYMAPEQLAGRGADERSDVYSLGAVLFEMATGERPYPGPDVASLVEQIARGNPRPAHDINPAVPPELSATIASALRRDRAARVGSALELDGALAALTAAPVPATTRIVAGPQPRIGRRTRLVAALGLTAAIALVALAVARRSRVAAPPTRPAVLAILPVETPSGDREAEYVGAGIASVVAGNFGSIPGLTVLSRAATSAFAAQRGDLAAVQRELGATLVLDLELPVVRPRASLVARLWKPDVPPPVWQQTFSGDVLTVETSLLAALGRALERAALARPLSPSERARVGRVPTTSAEALLAYSQARLLLQPSNSPDAPQRAVALLEQAIARDPQFALAYAALADAYWTRYQSEKDPALVARATAAVEAALRIDPGQAPVYTALATMYQQTGRYEDAVNAIRHALDLQPDSDESHRLFARILAARGEYDAAIAEARRAIAIRGDWSNQFALGQTEFAAGHIDRALEAFRRTTELNPSFAGGFQMLGAAWYMRGDLQNAIGNYEHSVRLAPNAPALSNLALAYYQARRYDESIAAYTGAIRRAPQDLKLYRNLADVYKAAGNPAAARTNYARTIALGERELAVNPRNAMAIVTVAICEANLGRRAEAERHAAEAAAIGGRDSDIRYRVAKVHLVLGRRAAALAAVRDAVAAGYDPDAARRDGELAVLRGADFDRALAAGLAARPADARVPR